MTTFEPLTMQRAIRDDENLTAPQKHVLHAATLRADNRTTDRGKEAGYVRTRKCKGAAQLAHDTRLSEKTVYRALRDERVVAYFRRVERTTGGVIRLWFTLSTPDTESSAFERTDSEHPGTRHRVQSHRTESPVPPDSESSVPALPAVSCIPPAPQAATADASAESINGWPAQIIRNCARQTSNDLDTVKQVAENTPAPDAPTSRALAAHVRQEAVA